MFPSALICFKLGEKNYCVKTQSLTSSTKLQQSKVREGLKAAIEIGNCSLKAVLCDKSRHHRQFASFLLKILIQNNYSDFTPISIKHESIWCKFQSGKIFHWCLISKTFGAMWSLVRVTRQDLSRAHRNVGKTI